ncbi:hypothetical protein AAC387_Pa06g0093 [Persea americana]
MSDPIVINERLYLTWRAYLEMMAHYLQCLYWDLGGAGRAGITLRGYERRVTELPSFLVELALLTELPSCLVELGFLTWLPSCRVKTLSRCSLPSRQTDGLCLPRPRTNG